MTPDQLARAMLRADRARRAGHRQGGTYVEPIVDLSRVSFAALVAWAEAVVRELERAEVRS